MRSLSVVRLGKGRFERPHAVLSNRILQCSFEFVLKWLLFIRRTHSARPTISENMSGQVPHPFNNNLRTPLIGSLGWIEILSQLSHSYSYLFSTVCTSFRRVVRSHLLKFLCDDAIWKDSSQRLTNLCLIIRPNTTIVYRYTPRQASKTSKKSLFWLVQ